jgi:hypothetical protein
MNPIRQSDGLTPAGLEYPLFPVSFVYDENTALLPGRAVTQQLFDPLRYLRRNLKCEVTLDPNGEIRLVFAGWQQEPTIRKARAVLHSYRSLIKFQLENNGASVRKLLAQGKIQLRDGRFIRST